MKKRSRSSLSEFPATQPSPAHRSSADSQLQETGDGHVGEKDDEEDGGGAHD